MSVSGLILTVLVLLPSVVVAQVATQPTTPAQVPAGQQSGTVDREDDFVRAPDTVRIPQPEFFPRLKEYLSTLPPFFRDSSLKLRSRTFYFNQQNDNGTANEALATGGWVQYASGWLFDTFAAGATYYASFPLYAPECCPGTLLLTPGGDAIGTFGEAWGALRYKDYALLKGYRQRVDAGYVNPKDDRMVPNTFEGVTLSGTVDWATYDLGYLTKIKPRDSNDFIPMSAQAGASGDGKGLALTSVTLTPIKDRLSLYVGNFYAFDVFNTAFGKAEYTHPVSQDVQLRFGVQYTDQRSVGEARVGDFATWNVGAGLRVGWRGLSAGTAAHFTGADASISSPWGTWPGYLSLQVTDFDQANEKAFGVSVKYDFGSTLLPFRIPGLTVQLLYAQGNDIISPATKQAQPTVREGDLDIIYNVPAVKGLSLRFRNAYVGSGKPETTMNFRLIINYELDLL
jgi:outer membrane porin, OprD family